MPVKTFCSCYIPLANIVDYQVLLDDHTRFNEMVRMSLGMKMADLAGKAAAYVAAKQAGQQVEKKKPGGGKRKEGSPSIHTQLKDKTQTTDYFVTSVESDLAAIVKGAKEMLDYRIQVQEERVEALNKKIEALDKQISNQQQVKNYLEARANAIKKGKTPPTFKGYQGCPYRAKERPDLDSTYHGGKPKRTLEISVVPFCSNKKKVKREPLVFQDAYLFELLYLDPKIRSLKTRRQQIKGRLDNTKKELDTLIQRKKDGNYPYRLVSYKKLKKWFPLPEKEQHRLFLKYRERDMLITGRHDAKQGNWVVKYATSTGELTYRSADAKYLIRIPGVRFSYGQEVINKSVDAEKSEQQAVSWAFHLSGKRLQIRCTVNIPESPDKNFSKSDGVIAIDKNYDNFAVTETNTIGQMIDHHVAGFQPEGKSHGQYEQILSLALEEVFRECVAKKKPLACEDIQHIKKKPLYQPKKRNRHISMFAYDKIDQLIQSKSEKYGVGVLYVNPAYTSQIGKRKYARMYGLTIHESASYVIGRRAMGLSEKVPQGYKKLVPAKLKDKPCIEQWKAVSRQLNKQPQKEKAKVKTSTAKCSVHVSKVIPAATIPEEDDLPF